MKTTVSLLCHTPTLAIVQGTFEGMTLDPVISNLIEECIEEVPGDFEWSRFTCICVTNDGQVQVTLNFTK